MWLSLLVCVALQATSSLSKPAVGPYGNYFDSQDLPAEMGAVAYLPALDAFLVAAEALYPAAGRAADEAEAAAEAAAAAAASTDSVELRPVAQAVAGPGGVAVASPVARAVLRRGHRPPAFRPAAVALAGPSGAAVASPELLVALVDDDQDHIPVDIEEHHPSDQTVNRQATIRQQFSRKNNSGDLKIMNE